MANLRICVRNAIDEATLSASPAMRSTLPPSNLQIPARARVARSTDASAAQEIKFTWNGAGCYLNFLILSRHNLEPGSTWRVRLYNTPDWTGAAVYDSGTLTAVDGATLGDLDFGVDLLGAGEFDAWLGQQFSVVYFTRVLALSGIVTMTNIGNAYGYVEASRLFAGEYTELAYNPASIDFSWPDNTEQSRSAGGSSRSDGDINYRAISVDLVFIRAEERASVADMLRHAGRRRSIFLSVFPGAGGEKERDHSLIGRIAGRNPVLRAEAGRDTLSMQLQVEED